MSYSHEDLVEHFLLTPSELDLVLKCRGDASHRDMALLLKTLLHLGYVPSLDEIPSEVREFVAAQSGRSRSGNQPAAESAVAVGALLKPCLFPVESLYNPCAAILLAII
jgi:hypothetical protein